MSDVSTIFDKIKAREIPAEVVYEDENILAFKDVNPQAPIHVLVIPQNKLSGFNDLADAPADQVGAYMVGVAKVAKKLGLDQDGYRIVFNSGKHGQQTVDYIHAHIIGGRQMQWPPG